MDLSKIESEIIKTGFVLENNVASILKSKGWTLISNRYYIDDQEESVREIDLLAYKVSNLENFQVFTALIISCKKSDANIWALLSRDLDIEGLVLDAGCGNPYADARTNSRRRKAFSGNEKRFWRTTK